MKKFVLLVVASLLSIMMYSNPNPNPNPELHINNFAFIGANHWQIGMLPEYCFVEDFDSIFIQSNEGIAKVVYIRSDGLMDFYFTDQDVSPTLTINPNGDVLTLTGYYWIFTTTCQVSFGNVPSPMLVAPLTGQSIERFKPANCLYPTVDDIFTIDKTQILINDTSSAFLINDTTGVFGTMTGTVYDKDGQPVPNLSFILDEKFTTDYRGRFSTRVYSRITTVHEICYENFPNDFWSALMEPISYTMIPDSTINRNINLYDSLLLSVSHPIQKPASGFKIFPNPVTNSIMLALSSDLSTSGLTLDIFDGNGIKVLTKTLDINVGVVKIAIDLVNGMYLAKLSSDGKMISSVRFIVNK